MTVRRAYFHGLGDVRIEEEDREPLGETDLRVEPVVAGMNPGTMLAGMSGSHPRMDADYVPLRHPAASMDLPNRLSQNGVGRVREVGDRVEGFEEDDLVAARVDYATESIVDTATDEPLAVPEPAVEAHALATQGGVALNAVRRADLTLGDDVVVVGAGPIGLGVVRMAALAGANRVVAVDLYENRLALAERFGATHTTTATGEALVEEVLPLVGDDLPGADPPEREGGADVVFDCAGVAEAVWAGLKLARYGGTVCVASMHSDPLDGVNLGSDFHLRELELVSAQQWGRSHEWPWTRQRNREFLSALASDGDLRLEEMVTHRVAFEDLPTAGIFETLAESPDEAVYALVTFE